MALILIPIASDSFVRSDASTLGPDWAIDTNSDPSLTILSDQCSPNNVGLSGANIFVGADVPNNQYAEIQVKALTDDNSNFTLGIRAATDLSTGYFLIVSGPLTIASSTTVKLMAYLTGDQHNSLYNETITVNVGDIFVLAALGSTITLLHNGSSLFSGTDSNLTSGAITLSETATSTSADAAVGNFSMGLASGSEPPASGLDAPTIFGTITSDRVISPSTSISGTGRRTQIVG